MKKSLFAMAIAATLALGFNACVPQEKTLTDYLTAPKNGWVLESATSTPGYVMSSGAIIDNLMEGYLYDYEKDDVIKFTADGIQTIEPGTNIPEDGSAYQEAISTPYSILQDATGKFLNMQVPFFYNDDYSSFDAPVEICEIINLDDNQLKIRCTMNDDENPAKPTYSFTLTYVPAK